MPDLKTRFHGAERIPVSNLWPEIVSHRPEPMRSGPGPVRRSFVGVIAILLAVGGIALAVRAFRPERPTDRGPSPSVGHSPIPPLTGDPRITARIPLTEDEGDAIGGVAVGEGSAWVGLSRADGGDSVVRIDLTTNEVVAEIPVEGAPWRKRIAATPDAVWVGSSDVLQRIDPATNSVVATVPIPGCCSAIEADGTAVWAVAIVDRSDQGLQNLGALVRVDPSTNEVVAEIPLGSQVAGYGDEVRLEAGSVWVLGTRLVAEDQERGGDLIRVDPASNRIVAEIPLGGFDMVVGTDEVWVRFAADGTFDETGERWLWTRIDVHTNAMSDPFEFEGHGLQLVTPEALWAVGYDREENVRVTRWDPRTLEPEARSEPIRSLFHDAVIDPASRTAWVSALRTLVRVDID